MCNGIGDHIYKGNCPGIMPISLSIGYLGDISTCDVLYINLILEQIRYYLKLKYIYLYFPIYIFRCYVFASLFLFFRYISLCIWHKLMVMVLIICPLYKKNCASLKNYYSINSIIICKAVSVSVKHNITKEHLQEWWKCQICLIYLQHKQFEKISCTRGGRGIHSIWNTMFIIMLVCMILFYGFADSTIRD